MPLIAEQTEVFEELAPFLQMAVAPSGVTVGDLAFVSSQTHYSTAIVAPTSNNQVNGDLVLDLFQSAIGDTGQGFSTAITRTESSWLDSGGRLPANQVFLAVECAFQVFLRSTQTTTDNTTKVTTIKNVSALEAIGKNLTWDVTIGDGITRSLGSLGAYGGLGAVYAGVPLVGATTAANTGAFNMASDAQSGAQGAFLGDACCYGAKLRVPLVFPPNVNVRIKVRNGNAFKVPSASSSASPATEQITLPTSQWLAVKQYLRGYLCTMPV